jgi:hypothetical protein
MSRLVEVVTELSEDPQVHVAVFTSKYTRLLVQPLRSRPGCRLPAAVRSGGGAGVGRTRGTAVRSSIRLGDDGQAYKQAIIGRFPTYAAPLVIDISNFYLFGTPIVIPSADRFKSLARRAFLGL